MRTWILERYQVYARVMLMMGVFLSPVVFDRRTQDVFNLLKLTILMVAILGAFAVYVAWSAERAVWLPRFRIGLLALGFLGACLIATAFSASPVVSLVGLYHRYGGLIPFLLYATLMALLVGLYWEKPGDLREIIRASVGASFILTIYVLIQAAGQDWIEWKDASGGPPPFPVGTMGNSNFAGGYLGIGIPFVAYLAATAKQEGWRAMLFVVLGLDLLALWFTQTRGGMIAAAVGLGAMVLLYRDRLPRWLRLGTLAAAGLAAVLAVLVLFHPGRDEPIPPFDRIDAFRTGTFTVRTYYWGTAVRIFKDHPLVGTGLDLYYANYPRYRLPEDGAQLGLTITDKPHNIFLEYLANAGLLGLGTYLALVGAGLFYGYRFSRRTEDPHRFLAIAFTSVLAGYLAQGVFSIDVPPLAAMGWIALGGIAAIADPAVRAAREGAAAAKQARPGKQAKQGRKKANARERVPVNRYGPTLWPIHITAVVLTLLLVVVGFRPVLADVKVKEGATAQQSEGADDRAAQAFDEAIRLNPAEASYRSQAGAWQENLATKSTDPIRQKVHFERARRYYLEALQRQPNNIFFVMNMARLHTTWAENLDPSKFLEAEQWWKRSVALDPTDWDVHNRYALMLNSYANQMKGDRAIRMRSAARLEVVVGIKPDLFAGWINLAKVYRALGDLERARQAAERAFELDPNDEEARAVLSGLSPTSTTR